LTAVAPSPSTAYRRLQPGQISKLMIAHRDGSGSRVVYTTDALIEAPNWTGDGRALIYNNDGRLFRISVDGGEGPHLISTAPLENLNNDHCLSPDGATIYLSANDGQLYAVPVGGGTAVQISTPKDQKRRFRHYLHGVSPDGRSLVYVGLEKTAAGQTVTNIYSQPVAGGDDRQLTDGSWPVDGPEYSADGNWIYFNSEQTARRAGDAQIFRMGIDGSGVEQLTDDARVNWFPHMSPDGQTVVYLSFPEATIGHPADKQVIVRTMTPDGTPLIDIDSFCGGQGTINVNSWSPDSAQFAYVAYPFERLDPA